MRALIVALSFTLSIGGSVFADGSGGIIAPEFVRGDADGNGIVDINDPVRIQNWLFRGWPAPACKDAADANDDGAVDGSDPTYINSFLFMGGPAPPQPGPYNCGTDPTSDSLGCTVGAC